MRARVYTMDTQIHGHGDTHAHVYTHACAHTGT